MFPQNLEFLDIERNNTWIDKFLDLHPSDYELKDIILFINNNWNDLTGLSEYDMTVGNLPNECKLLVCALEFNFTNFKVNWLRHIHLLIYV